MLFYGYLRFSLRFAFYTMPVEHPVMTAILSNIGRLGADEIEDLFGVPESYALPGSMLGRAYFGDRADAKTGRLEEVNFGRMNPALNAVTQLEQAQQALGLVSPLYSMVASQMFEEDVFTGRDFRVRGAYPPSESRRPYRDEETVESIRRSVRRERRRGTGERLLGQLLPIAAPQPSFGPQVTRA